MTTESPIVIECPACQAKFRTSAAHVGRRTKCPKCLAPFVVQIEGQPQPALEPPPPKPEPQVVHVGVNCRLCGTRMYGTLEDVGTLLTCPDCNSKTKLPPPPKPKGPNIPAAMLGEQYELWEGEQQPWGSTLAAEQALLVPVHCELCNTLQYANLDQVGTNLVCPDCGHATRVRPPKMVAAKATTHEPELEVEPPHVDGSQLMPAAAPPIYSRLQDFEAKSKEEQEREISRVATNHQARPKMPRWPLLTGWAKFLLAPDVISRWISLSVLITVFAAMAVFAFSMIFSGFGAVFGLPFLCGAAALCAMCYAAASACAVTVVTESSEGNDRMIDWPGNNPIDWMGEALYITIAASASMAPGYVAAQFVPGQPVLMVAAMLVSGWMMFPVLHLSTLEASSPFSLLMPGVVGSLREWPRQWALFYLLSGIDLAVAGVVVLLMLNSVTIWLIALPIIGGLGVYFRLLGRLAWRIRDDTPVATRRSRAAAAE